MERKTDKKFPLVSVIILNYNGLKYIDKCLKSVLCTDYPNFEVIFVDNASTDESCEYLERRYSFNPRTKIVKNPENYGFAKGNDVGANHASGKYIVFLNVDTKVDPAWLTKLVSTLELDTSIGAAQAKLLRMDDPGRLDTCGHKLTPYGFTYEID
ncbi:MAG: glycosyltransferase family 2 protein [Thermoprotei archaeon]